MSDGKIELKVGAFNLTVEGPVNWIDTIYNKITNDLPEITKNTQKIPLAKNTGSNDNKEEENEALEFKTSLAAYLKEKDAGTIQTKRFLATADWLRRKGNSTLSTSMVTKALQDNQQKRIGNPADCLNQNVSRGLCEKSGNGFFITPEGLTELKST